MDSAKSGALALWGMKIPIIGVTGPKWSGKSVFGSSIDPHNTLAIDLEGSTETYDFPFKQRYNLYDEIRQVCGDRQPTPLDCYLWFEKLIVDIQPSQYTVCFVDPISDIEAGLTQWVQENPKAFGHTAGQYEKMPAIMQADLQAKWKLFLGLLSSKVDTFCFTTHLGAVWGADNKPVPGKDKPKGKPVLTELASLYLQLDRKPRNDGTVPKKPTARVLKSRLMVSRFVDGQMELYDVLPPTVPECDPNKIREYIKNPVGMRQLQDAERAQPDVNLSDDEKLIIKSQIATAQLEVEQAKSSRMELLASAAKKNAAGAKKEAAKPLPEEVKPVQQAQPAQQVTGVVPPAEPVADPVKQVDTSPASQSIPPVPEATAEKPFNPAGEAPNNRQIVMQQFAMLSARDARFTQASIAASLNKEFGVDSVHKLTNEQVETVRKRLWSKLTAMGLMDANGEFVADDLPSGSVKN